jgi:hypothetical protein
LIVGPAEWIALAGFAGTVLVGIFTAGIAFGRMKALGTDVAALASDIAALKSWKEETRVDLGTNFVRKVELREAIETAIAPVRQTGEQTHDLVTRIAARMHIPAVESGE